VGVDVDCDEIVGIEHFEFGHFRFPTWRLDFSVRQIDYTI
jgi:hypothetical protein